LSFWRKSEYGIEPVDQKRTIPNPEYKTLTYQLKKAREKKSRLEARIFKELEDAEMIDQVLFSGKVFKNGFTIEKINAYNQEIKALIVKQKGIHARISIAEMTENKRYNKLKQEGKKLKNTISMPGYRAESALYSIVSEFY